MIGREGSAVGQPSRSEGDHESSPAQRRRTGSDESRIYTSTFNDRPLEEVLDFAKEAGFDAIELDVGGHIKSPDNVGPAVEKARERGLFVCSVTFFGNQLDPDAAKREDLRARLLLSRKQSARSKSRSW